MSKRRKLASFAAIPLLCLGSWSARASDAYCDGDKCAVPIQAGDEAPFSGQLLTEELALDLALKADRTDRVLELVREYERDKAQIQVDYQTELRKLDRERLEAHVSALEHALEETQPAWYEHPGITFGAGILTATLVFWGAVELVNRVD